jgi:hypothetical protein
MSSRHAIVYARANGSHALFITYYWILAYCVQTIFPGVFINSNEQLYRVLADDVRYGELASLYHRLLLTLQILDLQILYCEYNQSMLPYLLSP